MPCDKNYPYCNNPLNWERAAHQKEKGEKGLEVREVVVGETCQPVLNQDPRNKNFFPFWGGLLETHWDDKIEVNWKKAWENAPTINNPRIKLALAWRDDGGRMKSEWRWMTLRHVGWTIQQYTSLVAMSIQGQWAYLWTIPSHLEIRLARAIIVVITWTEGVFWTLHTSLKTWTTLQDYGSSWRLPERNQSFFFPLSSSLCTVLKGEQTHVGFIFDHISTG